MIEVDLPAQPTVEDVCSRLELFAPRVLAESWDNTGLLLGRTDVPVRRLLTCLTLTEQVAWEAAGFAAQLVITHHPLFFRAVRSLTGATAEGRTVLTLTERGIAVYSPHTAFDSAAAGINQQLAQSLGLVHIAPLRPREPGAPIGGGRFGLLPTPLSRAEFLRRVASVTSARWLEWCGSGPETIQRVAVGCGAGGEFLADAIRLGCDTFVTGESRFHGVLEAQATGVNLVLTGHYSSERPAVEQLANQIAEWFPMVVCRAAVSEQNPLQLFQWEDSDVSRR